MQRQNVVLVVVMAMAEVAVVGAVMGRGQDRGQDRGRSHTNPPITVDRIDRINDTLRLARRKTTIQRDPSHSISQCPPRYFMPSAVEGTTVDRRPPNARSRPP
jgi:hypothetical protein